MLRHSYDTKRSLFTWSNRKWIHFSNICWTDFCSACATASIALYDFKETTLLLLLHALFGTFVRPKLRTKEMCGDGGVECKRNSAFDTKQKLMQQSEINMKICSALWCDVYMFAFDFEIECEWAKEREKEREWLNKESNTIKWNIVTIYVNTLNVYKKLPRTQTMGATNRAVRGIFHSIYPFDRFDTYDFAISIDERKKFQREMCIFGFSFENININKSTKCDADMVVALNTNPNKLCVGIIFQSSDFFSFFLNHQFHIILLIFAICEKSESSTQRRFQFHFQYKRILRLHSPENK